MPYKANNRRLWLFICISFFVKKICFPKKKEIGEQTREVGVVIRIVI